MPNDIYSAPRSQLSANSANDIGTVKRVMGTMFLLLSVWLCYGTDKVIRQFAETFESFGVGLPLMTSLAVKLGFVFFWLALLNGLFLLIWVGSIVLKKREKPLYVFTKYNFFISLALFIAVMIALYLPIFELGSEV